MTTFLNGPAHGQTLMLRGSPRFLRVVDNGRKIDALDLPTDHPEKDERLYAYIRTAEHGMVHLNMGSRGGGWYPHCEYSFIALQPDQPTMRDPQLWKIWCGQFT